MKIPLTVLLLFCSVAAATKNLSLPDLLFGEDHNKSKITYYNQYNFYLRQPTSIGGSLTTEVAFFGENESRLGGLKSVRFIIDKQFLFPEDLKILQDNILKAALSCLNISDSRKSAIIKWVNLKNKVSNIESNEQFGPMNMTFVRKQLRGTNTYSTLVLLSRDGDPGKAPWVNYCTR